MAMHSKKLEDRTAVDAGRLYLAVVAITVLLGLVNYYWR
jgi:hypothetical protein